MKITIRKTPNVQASNEDIDIAILGYDIEDWEQLDDEQKEAAILEYVNQDDNLADYHFQFSIKILNDR